MEHSVKDSFTIRLAIILKNGLINTTPRSSQLNPRKHETLKQWWYNVGPTLKTMYQDY